jgi:hypothetical protein
MPGQPAITPAIVFDRGIGDLFVARYDIDTGKSNFSRETTWNPGSRATRKEYYV